MLFVPTKAKGFFFFFNAAVCTLAFSMITEPVALGTGWHTFVAHE